MEKQCPYCGATIKAQAKKCRYCNRWLEPQSNTDTRRKMYVFAGVCVALVVMFMLLISLYIGVSDSTDAEYYSTNLPAQPSSAQPSSPLRKINLKSGKAYRVVLQDTTVLWNGAQCKYNIDMTFAAGESAAAKAINKMLAKYGFDYDEDCPDVESYRKKYDQELADFFSEQSPDELSGFYGWTFTINTEEEEDAPKGMRVFNVYHDIYMGGIRPSMAHYELYFDEKTGALIKTDESYY